MDWHQIQRGEKYPQSLRPDEPGTCSDVTLLYNYKLILIHQRRNSEKGEKRYELHKYHTLGLKNKAMY